MSTIKTLTIISKEGNKSYQVGETYNGLLLDRIVDNSPESEISFTSIYMGKTADNELVFEVINAPIDVQYTA